MDLKLNNIDKLIYAKCNIFSCDFSDEQITTWFTSMRSQYGKLSNKKSGDGNDQSLTERDKWICSMFGFLDKHIYRVPSRSSAKVGK